MPKQIKPKYENLKTAQNPLFTVKVSRDVPLEKHMLDNIAKMSNTEIPSFMRLIITEGYRSVAKMSGIDVSHVRDFRTPDLKGKKVIRGHEETETQFVDRMNFEKSVKQVEFVQPETHSETHFDVSVNVEEDKNVTETKVVQEQSSSNENLPSFLKKTSNWTEQIQQGENQSKSSEQNFDLNM